MKMPKPIKQVLQNLISPKRYALLTHKVMQALTPKVKCYALCMDLLKNKKGFEIGGPSPIFGRDGMLPIYKIAGTIDNCNFSDKTTWEGALSEGANFYFDKFKPAGYQYIRDAVDLYGIESGTMDFVLSSHNIEHIANPLCALYEWMRVLKVNGHIILVVPHKDGTFDHCRPVTKFSHLLADYERGVGEDDQTHLEEILHLHDLSMDPEAGDLETFRERSKRNFENRCLHQHVFDTELVAKLMDHVGAEICALEARLPMHIIAVGRKLVEGDIGNNEKFLSPRAEYTFSSPFPSDRSQ